MVFLKAWMLALKEIEPWISYPPFGERDSCLCRSLAPQTTLLRELSDKCLASKMEKLNDAQGDVHNGLASQRCNRR